MYTPRDQRRTQRQYEKTAKAYRRQLVTDSKREVGTSPSVITVELRRELALLQDQLSLYRKFHTREAFLRKHPEQRTMEMTNHTERMFRVLRNA